MPETTSDPTADPHRHQHQPEDGRLVHADGRSTVRFERRYPYPPTEVWSAITESERVARWAFAAEFEPRTGGSVRFDYGEHGTAEGTIVVWDEPTVLEYEWGEGDATWHVRFELAADGDGTTLTFDHLLPDATRPEFAAGWHWHLDRLALHLSGGTPAQVDSDESFDRLMEHYRTELDSG